MMKLRLFLLIFLFVSAGLFAQNVSLEQALQTSTQAVVTRLPQGSKVAVLSFTSSSQRFSDYVIDEIATLISAQSFSNHIIDGALVRGNRIQVVERQYMDVIRRELNIQMSGDVSDDEVRRVGRQLGAQYVVTGSLTDIGNAYRFRVAAINVETAVREGSPSVNINSTDPQVVFLLTGQRVTAGPSAQTVSLDQALQTSAQTVVTRLPQGSKAAVLSFTSASQAFSDYVIDEIATLISAGNRIQIVERQYLDVIRRELNIQMSGNVSDDEVRRVGRQLGAQYVVTGSLVDTGPYYRFRAAAINVETAVREASPSLNININDPQVVFLLTGERGIPANFVRIQGGTFLMGSPSNEPERSDNEGPQHQVTVNSFYMGIYEVTQREWYEVMGTTIRQQRDMADRDRSWPLYGEGDNYPMYYISWYDAVEYCNTRSQREGLTPAYVINGINVTWNRNANGYRLPTEAEWEYACRAGTQTPYNTGISIRDNTGWYSANSNGTSHPVGQKPANAWGLHDMPGNVWEWCWDWYGSYSSGAQTDPAGAVSGDFRVMRGGSRDNNGRNLRSAHRGGGTPSDRVYIFGNVLGIFHEQGFRLVRNAQ
jgi:formylglycine-generating enzyme required for sulfatase activity/TolB-like protein